MNNIPIDDKTYYVLSTDEEKCPECGSYLTITREDGEEIGICDGCGYTETT